MEHLSKLETVAQLTGGVAHDFNNLLTAAMGCLEMILRDGKSGRITSLAEMALRSLNWGAQLTQQLLAFARRQTLRPVSADLNALLTEIEVLIRRAVGETIDVVIDVAPGLPRCEVDPAQFEAAVMNLVINARDAMPESGRVRLTIRKVETGQIPADIDLRSGDYVAFAVEDNGEGMRPEVAARAFEPFYTTKEIGKGSGLGLSMVYGFAKQSGGGVHIESAVGRGTSVTLYLPTASFTAENAQRTARRMSRGKVQARSSSSRMTLRFVTCRSKFSKTSGIAHWWLETARKRSKRCCAMTGSTCCLPTWSCRAACRGSHSRDRRR